MVRNSLLGIDSSIDEKIKLRQEFDISEEGKNIHSLKDIRRIDTTTITTMIDYMFYRDLK